MTGRLVDKEWGSELTIALRADNSALRIICPFIKAGALDRVLSCRPGEVMVITRFNLVDFAEGVSDVAALRKLLDRNHEFGLVAGDPPVIAACQAYFEDLWARGGEDLKQDQITEWEQTVVRHRVAGGRPGERADLGDFGADAGVANSLPVRLPVSVADAHRGFVKFLGRSDPDSRVPLSHSIVEAIKDSGCHWAVAYSYPESKRPRQVHDGDVVFIGWFTQRPNDIRIFGRAIGMKHVEGRDDAAHEDIERRPWKEKWSRYIRVHSAEFVAGTMRNGISLNGLMEALKADSFRSTQRNLGQGGNIDPRRAYLKQPAVELSREGMEWLSDQLQEAFDTHGKVPQAEIDSLDWPDLPPARVLNDGR